MRECWDFGWGTCASLGAVVVLAAGCAATPDFEHERGQVFNDTEVLCWVSTVPDFKAKSPEGFQAVTEELGERKALCTPEAVERGRKRVVVHFQREKELKARAASQNADSAEKFLKGAAFIAGAILLAPALSPPPPRQPVTTCQWQLNANGTGSAICR
jgi:hypothetical protein